MDLPPGLQKSGLLYLSSGWLDFCSPSVVVLILESSKDRLAGVLWVKIQNIWKTPGLGWVGREKSVLPKLL